MEMAPKSIDGSKMDGSSSDSEPMETFTDAGSSSLLGKRKVESSNSGESEGDREEVEDDSDPDWDKDSFDGVEYHPSDDDREYIDEDFMRRTRFYNRTVIETKGFFEDSEDLPQFLWAGIAIVYDLDDQLQIGITCRQFLAEMACLCLAKYNKRKGFNVKFDSILRANFNPGSTTKYYITFAARESDSSGEQLVEYQAKAARRAGETYPILCRPSPTPKTGGGGDQLKEASKVMEEGS